jgi:hypothetical protein
MDGEEATPLALVQAKEGNCRLYVHTGAFREKMKPVLHDSGEMWIAMLAIPRRMPGKR